MGEFIRIIIDQSKCGDKKMAQKLAAVCPVNIFLEKKGRLIINTGNEDECTLCELCRQICPESAITIDKLYEP